jgi:GTP-binding protein LepA
MSDINKIRNFCIISHIDHGKSTMADRMLELTKTLEKRDMKDQVLDRMELERERGITIKMQPVSMQYDLDGVGYQLNLIDTPGHIDFEYEVSRALKAVEGAILLVDASQGIQAQTIDTLNKAQKENLKIIPVVNKIDLPQAQSEEVASEIIDLIACKEEDIVFASGKTGEGVEEILRAVVDNFPAPEESSSKNAKALIFDSFYDNHLGVIAHIRLFEGQLSPVDNLYFCQSQTRAKSKGVGIFGPDLIAKDKLSIGQIGYLVTGLKDINKVLIGDTVTTAGTTLSSFEPLAGFKQINPKVYLSFYPADNEQFDDLKQAISKISLQDSSIDYSLESNPAFGRGLRIGFLGMLHSEIIQERLEREFELELIATSPSVRYKIMTAKNRQIITSDPAKVPDKNKIKSIQEPYVSLEILSPNDYLSVIMDMMKREEAQYKKTQYLSSEHGSDRVRLFYTAPLRTILVDFADKVKSISEGFASFNYRIIGYKQTDLVRLDVLLAGDIISPFSQVVPEDKADKFGRRITKKLKKLIPKHNFAVSIQAAVGKEIVAREDKPAYKKDVTGHLYGGDRTRKDKLLKKQAKGKKKMKKLGQVNLPTDVFKKVLEK